VKSRKTAPKSTFRLDTRRYSLDELVATTEAQLPLSLAPKSRARIQRCARFVQKLAVSDQHVYGVNSGFGSLCETRIKPEEVGALQLRHVLSHAAGVGPVVSERTSRFVMLVKLLTFRTGHTGITAETVERLMELWNRGIIPAIPKKGTVGASGDLSPLAHLALPLLGFGQVYYRGELREAAEVMAKEKLPPLELKAKEGLALTNGVQYINGIAVDAVSRFRELVGAAEVIASLSIQAFSAAQTFYDPLYHSTTEHPTRHQVSRHLSSILGGSNHWQLPTANRSKQDPYSFRCMPQVHGAIRQVLGFASNTIEDEVNGVSDNPLFFPEEGRVLFGGNLHGESTAFALDFLAIGATELANIAERRTYQLLSGCRGLPSFLTAMPGLDSGLMIPQYTSAALVNECKVLSTPASVDTIMTCQLQEDHVSMGGTSAYKAQEILDNVEIVLAIELLTAAQAIDLAQGLVLSKKTLAIHRAFRREVPMLREDRIQSVDIERARAFLNTHRRSWAHEAEV
jgi:histidine ammonia-lyase